MYVVYNFLIIFLINRVFWDLENGDVFINKNFFYKFLIVVF